jgi:predicted RNA-binding Zn-ribbon protein involved in translation (DUF1610 family)
VKRTLESEGDDADDEDPSEYAPEADDAGVFWCPKCGAEMYGDAGRCPSCGDDVTPGARPSSAMPGWVWAGLVLIGLAMLAGLIASFVR